MAKLEIPIIVNCTEIDELIDEIKHLQTYKLFEGDEQVLIDRDGAIEIFAKHIRASAQPEIVRCKDCKHRPFDGEDMRGFGVEFPDEKCPCQCDDGWYNWRPNNEWFCANAERREG